MGVFPQPQCRRRLKAIPRSAFVTVQPSARKPFFAEKTASFRIAKSGRMPRHTEASCRLSGSEAFCALIHLCIYTIFPFRIRLICLYNSKVSRDTTTPFIRLNGTTQITQKVSRLSTKGMMACPISTNASTGMPKAVP